MHEPDKHEAPMKKERKTDARSWVLSELLKPHPFRVFSSRTHDMRASVDSAGIDPRLRRWLLSAKYATEMRDCTGQDILSITPAGQALAKAWGVEGA